MIKVCITSGYRWSYFQWFILGLYELERLGEIKLKFRLPVASMILFRAKSNIVIRISDKLRRIFEKDSYNMDGYIIYNGIKKKFTIDSADAPYLFDSEKLKTVDVYFKMQCPKVLDTEGFSLTNDINIPWCDHAHKNASIKILTKRGERKRCIDFEKYKYKIKPLMSGTRQLSRGLSYEQLRNGYDNYFKDRRENKCKKVMCYFGNTKGPKPEKVNIPDYDWEGDLMGYFGESISHPNEKRAIIADYIEENIPQSDVRIINNSFSDTNTKSRPDLIIPLREFCAHVSKFEYNVNVSGYRMSIPSRFIESFMVGTAVITDKLHVKWYLPFDDEIIETVEMGYLPNDQVDWDKFERDISNLPRTNTKKIIKQFEEKWKPEVVARYILNKIKESDTL